MNRLVADVLSFHVPFASIEPIAVRTQPLTRPRASARGIAHRSHRFGGASFHHRGRDFVHTAGNGDYQSRHSVAAGAASASRSSDIRRLKGIVATSIAPSVVPRAIMAVQNPSQSWASAARIPILTAAHVQIARMYRSKTERNRERYGSARSVHSRPSLPQFRSDRKPQQNDQR